MTATRILYVPAADGQGRGIQVGIKLLDLGDGTWTIPIVNGDGSWSGGTLSGERTVLMQGADENGDGILVPLKVYDDPDSTAFILTAANPDGSNIGSGGGGGGGGARDAVSAPFTTPPDSNNWDQFNENFGTGATEQNFLGDVSVVINANDSQPRGLYRQLSTPYIATMAFVPTIAFNGANGAGVGFYDTVSHQLLTWSWTILAATYMGLKGAYYSDFSTLDSSPADFTPSLAPNPVWVRLSDDGSFRTIEFSMNGLDWRQIYISPSNEVFTADAVCIMAFGQYSRCTLVSYDEA